MPYRHIISFLICLFLGEPWGEYVALHIHSSHTRHSSGWEKVVTVFFGCHFLFLIYLLFLLLIFPQAVLLWDSCCWAFPPFPSLTADKTDLLVIFSFWEHSRVSLTKSLALLPVTSNSCGFNTSQFWGLTISYYFTPLPWMSYILSSPDTSAFKTTNFRRISLLTVFFASSFLRNPHSILLMHRFSFLSMLDLRS